MNQDIIIEQEPQVKVYYCQCGKSIEHAGNEQYFDRATKKQFKQAEQWGRKVETISLSEFHKVPFMCNGVSECTKPSTTQPC